MTSIVTRGGKGSALTITELDANFTNLNSDKVEKTRQVLTTTGQLTGGSSLTADLTLGLADSGVSPGTIGNSATAITPLVVDSKGRITGVGTNVTIAPAFSSVTGKPTTLSGYGITDAQSTVTGGASTITTANLTASKVLVSDASGKVSAATVSTTTLGYLDATSSVQNQIDGKQSTSLKNAANGYAGLDASGLLPTSVIPDLAIVQYLGTAANQTAMFALTDPITAGPPQSGDWCTRTDDGKVYVVIGNPSLATGWQALSYPTVPGITLNGTSISPGGTATITANTTNTLTIGTGLSGVSFNGSSAVTIAIDSTVATLTGSQTLTNKSISGSSNTLSNIPLAALAASAITFGATSQALGTTVSALNAVSIGQTTAAAGSFTTLGASGAVTLSPGSAAVTISPTGTGTVAISPAGALTINPTAASTINNCSIGATTAAAGAFTTLSASSTVSGTGFSNYLASPPAIGGTSPAAGSFTTLSTTGNATLGNSSAAVVTLNAGTVTLNNSTVISAASTKTLTLNGGGGTNGLVLDASNNVGIGLTPKAWSSSVALQLGTSLAPYMGLAQMTTGTADGYILWGAYLTGNRTFAYSTTGDAPCAYRQNAGAHAWLTTSSGTAGAACVLSSAMILDAGGNLGVGIAPSNRVHIYGDGSASLLKIQASNTNGNAMMNLVPNGTGNGVIYTETGSLQLAPSNSVRATLDGSGNWSNTGNASFNTGGLATYLRASGTAYTQIGDNQTLGAGTSFVIGSSPAYLGFQTAGTEQGRFTNAGVLSLTQGQIKFPAAQVASSDANTLDDYEEGTWTPTPNFLGTLTYTLQSGSYVKVGKLVTLTIDLAVNSSDTTQDATQVTITNLPFTVSTSSASGLLTERAYATYSSVSPHTFFIFPQAGVSYALVMESHWNGSIANASFYSSCQRKLYQGGTLYLRCSFSYYTS